MVASPCTIGGIADDTVIPAKAATQIQVNTAVIRLNRSLLTTSSGRPAAANSRTNGLPISAPTKAIRKIPALLSGCIHCSMNDWSVTKVRIASTENVATAPISKVSPGAFLAWPTTSPATAIPRATSTAVSNGTLPTSTQ